MGWVLGGGWKLKAGNTIQKEANSSAMSSVGHTNCHSQPGRTRQSSAPQVTLLVPISGPIDPAVIILVLQGRQKTACESRPGYL